MNLGGCGRWRGGWRDPAPWLLDGWREHNLQGLACVRNIDLGTRQDTDQEEKWGNGWVNKDKSTSACVQQLFGGGLDFSHFFLASLGNEGEFQKLDARRYQSANLAEISSTSYTWGRGSSTSRSPALSALAGEVTKVVGGVPEAGLLESPTWGWF